MEETIRKAARIRLLAHDVHGILTSNQFLCDSHDKVHHQGYRMDGFGELSMLANGIRVALLDAISMPGTSKGEGEKK